MSEAVSSHRSGGPPSMAAPGWRSLPRASKGKLTKVTGRLAPQCMPCQGGSVGSQASMHPCLHSLRKVAPGCSASVASRRRCQLTASTPLQRECAPTAAPHEVRSRVASVVPCKGMRRVRSKPTVRGWGSSRRSRAFKPASHLSTAQLVGSVRCRVLERSDRSEVHAMSHTRVCSEVIHQRQRAYCQVCTHHPA